MYCSLLQNTTFDVVEIGYVPIMRLLVDTPDSPDDEVWIAEFVIIAASGPSPASLMYVQVLGVSLGKEHGAV